MLAGTRQRRRGPSSSVLKHSTAGDHISNIFSLIVRYFVAFPPFQPPLCGSAQLSHCWNLPSARHNSLLGSASPPPWPALPQPHPPAGHPHGDPSSTQTQQHPLHILPLSITACTGHLEAPASASSSDPQSSQTRDTFLSPRVFHNLSENTSELQVLCSQGAPLPLLPGPEEGLRPHRDGRCGRLKQYKAVHRTSLPPPQPAPTIPTALSSRVTAAQTMKHSWPSCC